MTPIPDHVGREAVRLLNEEVFYDNNKYSWPECRGSDAVITVAKLLMNPPAPMTDPDEEAAKRVIEATFVKIDWTLNKDALSRATEQMRREREAWEAGR